MLTSERMSSSIPDVWSHETELTWPTEAGPNVCLGVDGGGTSTTCVVLLLDSITRSLDAQSDANPKFSLVGRGSSGSSNCNSVGDMKARHSLELAMASALKGSRAPRAAVKVVCLGLSGVDHKDDVNKVTSWMKEVFLHETLLLVHNDSMVALASGTGGEVTRGIVLIAGTGTVAFGVNKHGEQWRSAGGGPVLGDRGSGYAIAVEALSAAMRFHDGRGSSTTLLPHILEHLGLHSACDLIRWAYTDSTWARVAALVPVVKSCAASGDCVARNILHEAVQELAISVKAVATNLNLSSELDPFPLVLIGGVLENAECWDVADELTKELNVSLPAIKPIFPKVEPAVGAALLGWTTFLRHKCSCNTN